MDIYQTLLLINDQFPIKSALDACGVKRQQRGDACQVQCPFHKGGQENKWSARAYQDSNKMWCYTENRMFSVSDILKHGLQMSTAEVVAWVKQRFQLDLNKAPREKEKADPVLELLERKLVEKRGKVSLKAYREVAYAIQRTQEDDIDHEVKVERVKRIQQATAALV